MANLSTIKRPQSLKRAYRRVGRGQSSTRGKQSGRGGKGQTARAGHKIRPAMRDIIKKIPKRRGFGKNRGRTVWAMKPRPLTITLSQIEKNFDVGSEITPKILLERGLVTSHRGRILMVKVVGSEGVSKKFSLKGITASVGARAALEKAGGTLS